MWSSPIHCHSMVPGGFEVMSWTTQFLWTRLWHAHDLCMTSPPSRRRRVWYALGTVLLVGLSLACPHCAASRLPEALTTDQA